MSGFIALMRIICHCVGLRAGGAGLRAGGATGGNELSLMFHRLLLNSMPSCLSYSLKHNNSVLGLLPSANEVARK